MYIYFPHGSADIAPCTQIASNINDLFKQIESVQSKFKKKKL